MRNEDNLLEYLKDKKIFIISDSDLDGISANIIARYYLQPIVQNFNFNITSDRNFATINYDYINQNDIIIFIDTSPNFEFYNILKNDYKKDIIIIDHHKTSFDIYNEKIDNFYWDLNQCGSELFYNLLTKHIRSKRIISQYISLVSTYDLWKDDSLLWKDAKNLNSILYEYVNWKDKNRNDNNQFDTFIFNQLYKFNNYKHFFITKDEQSKAENAARKEKENLSQARRSLKIRKDSQNNLYLYFECDSKLSYIASTLLKEYEEKNIKYCIGRSLYAFNQKKELHLSIRSLDEKKFDCEYAAKLYQGGGHTRAAAINFTNKNEKNYFDLISGKKHLI